jgi:monoamine oxidase
MFVELGGEFVDSNHEDLHTLAKEVGVEMQDLTTEGGEELYFFKGQFHTPKDMVDPEKKSGAFAPIAKQIAKDAAKLTDKHENWTKYATKLDNTSIKAYLDQFRGKADDRAIDLLDVAYNIEFGLLRKINPAWRWWTSSPPTWTSRSRCSARATRSTASKAVHRR